MGVMNETLQVEWQPSLSSPKTRFRLLGIEVSDSSTLMRQKIFLTSLRYRASQSGKVRACIHVSKKSKAIALERMWIHVFCGQLIKQSYLLLQVTMSSLVDTGSKIDVCKVSVTKRQSCGDFLGNTLPCTVSPGYRGASWSPFLTSFDAVVVWQVSTVPCPSKAFAYVPYE